MYSLYYLVLCFSSDLCVAIVQLYRKYYLYYLVLYCSLDLCATYLDYSSAMTQTLRDLAEPTYLVASNDSCCPPLATRRRSRSNCGAPVPAVCHQPSIRLHSPVPIRSTQPSKPAKLAPSNHFRTAKPSAVSQSRIFHQICFIRFIIRSIRPIKPAMTALQDIFKLTQRSLIASSVFFIRLPPLQPIFKPTRQAL